VAQAEDAGRRGDEEEPHHDPDDAERPVAAARPLPLGAVVVDLARGVATAEHRHPRDAADRQGQPDGVEEERGEDDVH
jgi:hypothetical protein